MAKEVTLLVSLTLGLAGLSKTWCYWSSTIVVMIIWEHVGLGSIAMDLLEMDIAHDVFFT